MRFISLVLFSVSSIVVFGQNSIQKAINSLANSADMQFASISFCAIDMDKNQVLAEHNPDMSLPTASSMKAITTGTALAILGADFKFETHIEYDGQIKDGVLYGNIYFTGGGDPSLGSPYMEGVVSPDALAAEIAQALKKAGIKNIKGNIVGDGSYYEVASTVPTWQWMDTGNHYGAGVMGLNFHDNLYFMGLEQTATLGAEPKIKEIRPEQPNLKFFNELTSAGKNTGDNAYIYAAPYGSEAWVRGTIPVGTGIFRIKGAVTDPELFAANWLCQSLKTLGFSISGKAAAQRLIANKTQRKRIHTHFSPSLSAIIKHTNELSRNMYCESFVKMIGKKLKNEGAQEAGIAAVNEFWKGRGIETRGFFMEDGSGLSARNGVTSKTMAQMMRKMFVDSKSFPNFHNLLAISGETGNFKYMGKNTLLQGNLHGKGGTMTRIRSYTGFITTRSKRKVAFAVIVNNFSCSGQAIRESLENLMLSIAELSD